MFGRKKHNDPSIHVTPEKLAAIRVLQEALDRRRTAESLNQEIHDRASQLAIVKEQNHFYDSFVTILRVE